MSLNQAKIKLAILYRMHQVIENGEMTSSYEDVLKFYPDQIPQGRIDFAIEELLGDGSIENVQHPYSEDTYLKVSRSGMDEVDRALKVPNSFIFRLHNNEEGWLFSDEAANAVLKKKSRSSAGGPDAYAAPIPPEFESKTAGSDRSPVVINNNMNPSISNQNTTVQASDPEVNRIAKSGTRAAWIGAIVAIVAILVSLYVGGKLG